MPLAAWQATIVDESGNVQAGASIEVRREDTGALAAIYADRDGNTPLSNPFNADEDGFARFHVSGGAFRITATKGSYSRTWRYVGIGLASEHDDLPSTRIRYERTPAEAAAGVTPTNYAYPPGDVRRYGAVGDGVTDDTAAIQAAITINGQAHVKLPVGTVTVGSQITINGISNVSLIGSGKDSVIDARSLGNTFAIRVLGSATDVAELASAADRWATSIEVDDASGLAAGDLIEIESTEVVQEPTEHVKHEFQIVDSVNGTTVNLRGGLWFDYSVTGETVTIRKVTPVENVTFENFTILMNGSANEQQAIEVVYGKNVTFRNVRVIDAYRDGLKATKCYNVWFNNNYVEGTRTPVTGYGLYSSYSDNVTFINNKGFRNRHTIEIAAGNNTLVIGNQCTWDLSQGISTHGGANFTTVIGNTVSHCGGGIRMRGANSTIVDNEILGFNRNQGISIGEEGTNRRGLAGTNLIVQRNRIIAQEGSSMTSLDGIYSVNEIVNSSICDNDIWAGRNGILINGYRVANSDFSRNRIHKTDNSGSGIRLRMGAVGTQDGSVTRDVQHTRVSDNWFGDVAGAAIEVGSTLSDGEQGGIVIANNHFANVAGRGIELYGSFNGPVIRGNTGQAATRNLGLSNATFDTRNPLIADNVNLSPAVAQIGVTADTDGSGNASITFLRPLPLKPFIFTAIEDSTYSLIVRYSLSTDSDGKFTGATFTVTDHAGVAKPSVRVRYRIEYYNTLSDT